MFRPLKVYAFGPSLGRAPGNVMTIPVRYEKLAPGPAGNRVVVVDYDASRDCFYDPVDLDDPLIAIGGGVDPSESDPHFHQQMCYAVVCETLRRVESALGRTTRRRTIRGASAFRLLVYPHGARLKNAYATDGGRLVFGYFRAAKKATGATAPGQTVFSCLMHDVIVYTATHAILRATRPDLFQPGNSTDAAAFTEALSATASLLLHFSYREAVLDTIQRTAGTLSEALLAADHDHGSAGPQIQAELRAHNPLVALAQGFGEALGRSGGLRNALQAHPEALEIIEPHERGGIVVAAIFDAFFSIYLRRTADLFRIYRAGGGRLEGGYFPTPLAERLCGEAERIAARLFDVCVGAVDYCPAGNMALGDFLRACITIDSDYSPKDEWDLRDALMQAFRRRGIRPPKASFFSEDALRWPIVDERTLEVTTLKHVGMPDPDESARRDNRRSLLRFVEANAKPLGLLPGLPFVVYPLDVIRRTGRDERMEMRLCTQVVQRDDEPGLTPGVTLVFEATGRLRYAIRSGQPRRV